MVTSAGPAPTLAYASRALSPVNRYALVSLVTAFIAPLGPGLLVVLWELGLFFSEGTDPVHYGADLEGAATFALVYAINYTCPTAALVYGVAAFLRARRAPVPPRGTWLAILGILGGVAGWYLIAISQPRVRY